MPELQQSLNGKMLERAEIEREEKADPRCRVE
jgi:hypothetical protein